MTWDEKLFLAVVAFLLLKGLIKASEAADRDRVRHVWQNLTQTTRQQLDTSKTRL